MMSLSTHPSRTLVVEPADAAASPVPRAWTPARTKWRHALLWLAIAAASALAGVVAYRAILHRQLDAHAATATRRLDFFAQSLSTLIDRHEALPALIGLEGRLGEMLDAPDASRIDKANHYLHQVAVNAGINAAYVMNANGLTLASSNWNDPVSFINQNYAFRPYFQDAAAGRLGRFYGVGVTTGEAGYFLARGVATPSGQRGVVAVKVSLDAFESAIRQSGEAVMLSDADGVVFLSAVPAWKYRTLSHLSGQTRARIEAARQYGQQPLTPLAGDMAVADSSSLRLVRSGIASDYSVTSRPIGPMGWRMTLLTDREAARHDAALAGIAAGCATALMLAVAMQLRLARGRHAERVASAKALQELTQSLDRQLAERTADITAAHQVLERKVGELQRTEAILRETRDSAVQAGKLAVLGQMSAGMSHELNQPLAALHTLSDNAMQLMKRQRYDEASGNLALISQLTARMGNIVRQLKSFARNERTVLTTVDVATAVEHALLIAEPRRREVRAEIEVSPGLSSLRVRADAVRLEQVIVNLVCNALDAAAGTASPRVVVAAEALPAAGGTAPLIAIHVGDSGLGIEPEALRRLFEPFYTTKPIGEGLGLGLALSLSIVESFGGRLEARNLAGGGAEFSIILQAS
jgi:two-component system C4-dicarboxylate transport sensor histidine kinase DctB